MKVGYFISGYNGSWVTEYGGGTTNNFANNGEVWHNFAITKSGTDVKFG